MNSDDSATKQNGDLFPLDENTEETESDVENALSKVPDEILVRVLASRVQGNPSEETPKLIHAVQRSSSRFSGPLPPPEILRGYDDVKSGFANRVIKMAEREQAHRHDMEKNALGATARDTVLGQVFAFVLSGLIISGGIFLVASGHEVSGTLLTGATLTGLAYLFITGRQQENQNDEPEENVAPPEETRQD